MVQNIPKSAQNSPKSAPNDPNLVKIRQNPSKSVQRGVGLDFFLGPLNKTLTQLGVYWADAMLCEKVSSKRQSGRVYLPQAATDFDRCWTMLEHVA